MFRREIKFERPILLDPFSCFLFRVFPLSMLVGVFVNFFFYFSFVSVCGNHRGLFSHVVCVPFLSVFVACVCYREYCIDFCVFFGVFGWLFVVTLLLSSCECCSCGHFSSFCCL